MSDHHESDPRAGEAKATTAAETMIALGRAGVTVEDVRRIILSTATAQRVARALDPTRATRQASVVTQSELTAIRRLGDSFVITDADVIRAWGITEPAVAGKVPFPADALQWCADENDRCPEVNSWHLIRVFRRKLGPMLRDLPPKLKPSTDFIRGLSQSEGTRLRNREPLWDGYRLINMCPIPSGDVQLEGAKRYINAALPGAVAARIDIAALCQSFISYFWVHGGSPLIGRPALFVRDDHKSGMGLLVDEVTDPGSSAPQCTFTSPERHTYGDSCYFLEISPPA
jgi:hypothetical protein